MTFKLDIQFFGGRGASFSRRIGPSSKNWLEPLDPNATFENTIGNKGDSVTIGVTEQEVNPNFENGRKWQINCQRCAFTEEFERRGYNVTALPNTGKNVFYSTKIGIEEVMGKKFSDMGGANVEETLNNICATFKKEGVGSRGFIMMYWKGSGGHIFNVEQLKTGTRFVDAQIHKTVDIRATLNRAQLDSVAIARVDNIPTSNFNPSHLKNIMTISKNNINHNKKK